MPAVSEKQAVAARIAEHAPGKLFKRNRGLLSMKKGDLRKFAKTKGVDSKRPYASLVK